MKRVKHVKVKKGMKVDELVRGMNESGVFMAGKLAKAVDIVEKMIKDKDCRVFFGVSGAMIPGGMREVLLEILKNKWVDVFVTTGAMLTHDLIEGLGYGHYRGSENVDDSMLNKKGFDRIYNSYMSNNVYEGLEKFIHKHYDLLRREESVSGFINKLGEVSPEDSILNVCYKNKIPVFCPAIANSGIGLMMWGKLAEGKKVDVKAFEDLKEILDLAWSSKKTGVWYINGGEPKNYIQQAMQFSKEARYGVQIMMNRVEDGGSSGAPLREGISWGKLTNDAEYVDVIVDATIAMPIIVAALKERIS